MWCFPRTVDVGKYSMKIMITKYFSRFTSKMQHVSSFILLDNANKNLLLIYRLFFTLYNSVTACNIENPFINVYRCFLELLFKQHDTWCGYWYFGRKLSSISHNHLRKFIIHVSTFRFGFFKQKPFANLQVTESSTYYSRGSFNLYISFRISGCGIR